MENPVMMLVVAFIGVSIMLSIAVAILSGTSSSFDCTKMTGYTGTTDAHKSDSTKYTTGTWAGTCYQVQAQTQQSMTLLVVILVIIAAVAILVVIRML